MTQDYLGRIGNLIRDARKHRGMTQQQLEALRLLLDGPQRSRDNIGLRNVNQRCRLYYGEHYGIELDSRLSEGTTVRLTIPADPAQ